MEMRHVVLVLAVISGFVVSDWAFHWFLLAAERLWLMSPFSFSKWAIFAENALISGIFSASDYTCQRLLAAVFA